MGLSGARLLYPPMTARSSHSRPAVQVLTWCASLMSAKKFVKNGFSKPESKGQWTGSIVTRSYQPTSVRAQTGPLSTHGAYGSGAPAHHAPVIIEGDVSESLRAQLRPDPPRRLIAYRATDFRTTVIV